MFISISQNDKPVIEVTYSDLFNVGELETASRDVFYFTVTDAQNDWFTCDLKIKDLHGNDNDHNEFILKNTSRTGKQTTCQL